MLGHRERLFNNAQVTTTERIQLSGTDQWSSYNSIAADLDVTSAAAGVGDTLIVKVQTRIGLQWYDVLTFTTVLGNGGAVHQSKSTTEDSSITWFNHLRAVATPGGAGANFTFTLYIEGS